MPGPHKTYESRLSPHVPPMIQVQHLPERRVLCQRQRYQPRRHSPPDPGIGTLSPAGRKFGVIGASPTRKTKSAYQRERFFEHPYPRLLALSDLAIRSTQIMAKIRNDKVLND